MATEPYRHLQELRHLTWNLAKTLHDAGSTDNLVEVRACFNKNSAPGYDCAQPIQVTLDRSAFGGSYATAQIGPGNVALQTGDFSLTTSDAGLFGVEIDRTLTTLDPTANRDDEQLAENKAFGPGWRAGFPSVPSGITAFSPTTGTDSLQLVGPSGETLTYVRNGQTFTGVNDASDGSQITVGAEELTATNATGSKATYTKLNGKWVIARAETPAAESAVTYYRDTQGRVTRVLASAPTGVTCGATLVASCRALELGYASSTTATGVASGWGDYAGQVKQVSFTAFDPATNAMKTTALATYLYDSTGHLRQVTDPRTNLVTTYYYNAEGRLSQLTPPGLAPWRLEYDTTGRLAHAQREGGAVDPTWAVAYDVPIGGTGAPVDLTLPQTTTWSQNTDLPTTGTAIFPASHLPPRSGTGAYQPVAGDWEYGQLTYTDVNGRPVNIASYGAGAWQISAHRYDDRGNTVWQLSASNRAQVLNPTADTDSYVAGRTDSAERANLLATIGTYNTDSDLLSAEGPAHSIVLADGTTASARQRTTNTYDEGKPSNSVDYHLVTTSKIEPVVLDGTVTPGTADVHTTRTGYDPIKAGDVPGWGMRLPTSSTTAMAGQVDIVKKTRYDTAGREIERRMPSSNGSDSGTTVSAYYTAGPHSVFAECGNKPQWAGLTCRTALTNQPTGKPLPITVTTYDFLGVPATVVETAGTTVRTTTMNHDGAGRLVGSEITVTPASEGGVALPGSTISYDSATGLRTGITTGSTTLTTTYDTIGRVVTTTDADGGITTTDYTLDGQIGSVTDPRGTTAYSYNGTDAMGRAERRGPPTSINFGQPGAFTAAFDSDGRLAAQGYLNGLVATTRYDNTGVRTGLRYTMGTSTWLSFQQKIDIVGQVIQAASSDSGNQRYTYDQAGRLTSVADAYAGACATRRYGLNANSNRASLKTFPPATDGNCSTGTTPTTKTSSYDDADRLTNAGYVYDAFGRTTTVPAADVVGGADVTIDYYTNDFVSSLTQNGQTKTYAIDPLGRIRSVTTTSSSGSGTVVNHYGDESDSPSWTAEAGGVWTRNLRPFNGLAAVQTSGGVTQLQLPNLHGDIVAICDATSGISAYYGQTEYGQDRPNVGAPQRYGWLGQHQRSRDAFGGIILMGARLYNPKTGRFLQVDPIEGGSDNAYEYAGQDPVNNTDLDGTKKKSTKTKKPAAAKKPKKGGKNGVKCGSNFYKQWCNIYLDEENAADLVDFLNAGAGAATICTTIAAFTGAEPVAAICGIIAGGAVVLASAINYVNRNSGGSGVKIVCVDYYSALPTNVCYVDSQVGGISEKIPGI